MSDEGVCLMGVFSIWESRFPTEAATEGRAVTEAIWRDMPSFEGYLRHVVVQDLDDPGHLLVISEWESRAAADSVRDEYASQENARRAEALVSEPRRRIIGQALNGQDG